MFGGRAITASARTLGLGSGVFFGAFMGLFGWIQGSRWYVALILGSAAGAFFGYCMGGILAHQYAGIRAATGSDEEAVQRAAARASWRGPLPEDPEVRRGALGVARHQEAELSRGAGRRRWGFVAAGAAYVVFAVAWSQWWWVGGAVLFSGLAAMQAWMPPRLARRADQLARDAGGDASRPAP